MPVLVKGKPVTQTAAKIRVTNKFKPGRYRFELVAIDAAKNASGPTFINVTVKAPVRVNPGIDPRATDIWRGRLGRRTADRRIRRRVIRPGGN